MKAYWDRKRQEKKESEPQDNLEQVEMQGVEAIIPSQPEMSGWKGKNGSKAIQARWAGEQATEEDLRDFFLSLPIEKAMTLLGKMRKNCEIAGKIMNERINVPEVQKCATCGITWQDFIKTSRKSDWFLNRPHYHKEDRNIIVVDHYCSAACVSYANNETQGVRGIADRGMLPSDNPKNHPHLKNA